MGGRVRGGQAGGWVCGYAGLHGSLLYTGNQACAVCRAEQSGAQTRPVTVHATPPDRLADPPDTIKARLQVQRAGPGAQYRSTGHAFVTVRPTARVAPRQPGPEQPASVAGRPKTLVLGGSRRTPVCQQLYCLLDMQLYSAAPQHAIEALPGLFERQGLPRVFTPTDCQG